MSLIWSIEEKELLKKVRSSLSNAEIVLLFKVLKFNRSEESINKMSRALKVKFLDYGLPLGLTGLQKFHVDEIIKNRKIKLNSINPEIILTTKEKTEITKIRNEKTHSMLEELRNIREIVPRNSSISFLKSEDKNKRSLCLILSDIHYGRKVENHEENRTIYSAKIAHERILSTPEILISTITNDQKARIDELVILIIGDIVDGEGIYDHQLTELDIFASDQVLGATKALWECIKRLKKLFPLVRIITTKGNHGRTRGSLEANWDNMVYQQLELLVDLNNDPQLTIKNRYGDYTIVDVKGFKGLLRHRAPVHSDSGSTQGKFAGWHEIHQFDFFCYGHYHHIGINDWNEKTIIRNGSMIGADNYSEELSFRNGPQQMLFEIDAELGLTWFAPLKYRK